MSDRPQCPECEDCDCWDEDDWAQDEEDRAGAYELDDPKHPSFHDRYADLADMQDAA